MLKRLFTLQCTAAAKPSSERRLGIGSGRCVGELRPSGLTTVKENVPGRIWRPPGVLRPLFGPRPGPKGRVPKDGVRRHAFGEGARACGMG